MIIEYDKNLLSTRTFNCLCRTPLIEREIGEPLTLEMILSLDNRKLSKIRNMGVKSANELVNFLKNQGFEHWNNGERIEILPEKDKYDCKKCNECPYKRMVI